MTKKSFTFSSATVTYYFDAAFESIEKLVSKEQSIIITDENVLLKHPKKFKGWKLISIPAGEEHKVQATVDSIITQLIELGADRQTTLIGVGGGVVTDITGYVAGIFMRGISCAFVPTTILAMVDAAIGGKNGVDVGVYKNMVGLIRQPKFLLYDFTFLKTLPKEEWVNGFAEIIKHACIKDAPMFEHLEANNLPVYQKNSIAIAQLVVRNALLKTKVVVKDEFEENERKQLNFGHTVGHAVENLYNIPHGHAVSIGMGVACNISAQLSNFKETERVIALLKKYSLPPNFDYDKSETLRITKSDKKKNKDVMNFILLKKIGKAFIHSIPINELENLI